LEKELQELQEFRSSGVAELMKHGRWIRGLIGEGVAGVTGVQELQNGGGAEGWIRALIEEGVAGVTGVQELQNGEAEGWIRALIEGGVQEFQNW